MGTPDDWPGTPGKTQISKSNATPPHYNYFYKGIKLDPYRILKIYDITNPAQSHAIKKLLRAGEAHKDLKADINETIDTLIRWKEMIEEDSENEK